MNPRFILAQAWFTGAKALKSTYISMISSLGLPLSILFAVTILSGGKLVSYALVGGVVSVFTIIGIYCLGDIGTHKLEYMYKDLIIATKSSPLEYMTGVVIASTLWSLPGIVLYFILDLVYNLLTPYTFVMSLIVGILVLISTSSIAFLVGSFLKTIRNVWSTSSILSVILTVLPPTFYPYAFLPSNILNILMILPTTDGAVFLQGVFGLEPIMWNAFYILVAETIILLLLAKYATVWRER